MVLRAQCSFQLDTDFPRDQIVITPHFSVDGAWIPGEFDPDSLANDLATALRTWHGKAAQTQVKLYDADAPAPNFPLATATKDPGLKVNSTLPRELAICLSFYSERNLPRQRGRLYIPPGLYFTGSAVGPRPTSALWAKVADLVPIFTNLGGSNVDWVVYSRRDGQARKVTDWWIDDEWDAQRSRGLAATMRQKGTTGE